MNRYEITPERRAEFEQREGEDVYGWISRQISMAKPYELVWLYLLRDDDVQRRAMEMTVQHRAAWWTRFAAVASSVIAVLATIVAIVAIVAN